MKNWKDEKSGGKRCSSILEIGRFKLIVHNYVGSGDQLFVSCYGLFNKIGITATDYPSARCVAIDMLKDVLENTLNEINDV